MPVQYYQSITNITWQINSRFGTAAIDSAPAQWGLAGYSKRQLTAGVLRFLNAAITGIVNLPRNLELIKGLISFQLT